MARKPGVGIKKKQGYFHAGHFASLIEGIFQDAINAVGNAGQKAIMLELFENSAQAILNAAQLKQRPGKRIYESIMALSIRQDKYNAADEIVKEIAEKLAQAWDDAYAGDSVGSKMFQQLSPEDFIDTPPSLASNYIQIRIKLLGGRL